MKQIQAIAAAALTAAAIAAGACSPAGDADAAVARAAARCPVAVEGVGHISSITLRGDTLSYVCTVTDPGIDLERMAPAAGAMKRAMLPAIAGLFDQDPDLLRLLKAREWTLEVNYVGASSGIVLPLWFAPGEIGTSGDAGGESPGKRLADELQLSRAQLPARISDAVVIDSITDDGRRVVFECSVDEVVAGTDAIGAMRSQAGEIRRGMAQTLLESTDADVRRMASVTADAGRSLAYRYRGTITADTLTISFAAAELRRR